MIFVRHHEECAGRPSVDGKLRGKCDCKVAPMDEAARKVTIAMIEALDQGSQHVDEDREYLALRYDMLAELFEDAAAKVRRDVKKTVKKEVKARRLSHREPVRVLRKKRGS